MSAFPSRFPRQPALALALAAGIALLTAGHASGQVQESRMAELLNPDRTKAADIGNKHFEISSAVGGKQARIKSYAFTHSSVYGGADGVFRTRDFADRGRFRTGEFATKADRANNANTFIPADRGFATKALPVRDVPGVDKAYGVRKYSPADKSIVIRGKRQGDLDELYHQKNLDIEQVREILNKPGRGTDAPVQKIGDAPVMRALPVTPASAAR